MRFHMLQNVQMALDFLRYKKIKLVNIRAEDIVDGNPKLTLGLIWTIILHFQVSGCSCLPEIIYPMIRHHVKFSGLRKFSAWKKTISTWFALSNRDYRRNNDRVLSEV